MLRTRRVTLLVAVACRATALSLILLMLPHGASAEDRRIEEIVVYGERTESTVSDTSISITALPGDFMEAMGIQSADELVNFLPATTRTDYDIKIRGIGRNFRGLGGDPGVGTYYNGIYSPDFSIAATENALYDVERIEVLRGPQGTLYGRNSIGGVVNYVTRQPNHEALEGQLRGIIGEFNTRQGYAVLSGPLGDKLAYRLTGMKAKADGNFEGMGPADDIEDFNDQNFSLILDWLVTDNFTANLRFNDRRSRRDGNFGKGVTAVLSEGPCIGEHPITSLNGCDPRYRVSRDTNYYSPGLRVVDADTPGAFPYTHPTTGEVIYAHYLREGVDPTAWPFSPSPNYGDPWVARYDPGDNETPNPNALHNNFNREGFDHQATSLTLDWEPNEALKVTYLGNYQWFDYWFDSDNDLSPSLLSSIGDTAREEVWSYSHELRLFWSLGERWTATSGIYYFKEDRDQAYGVRNRLGKDYVNNPTIYGPPGYETWVRDAFPWLPDCADWRQAPLNDPGVFGAYCGDDGVAHSNTNDIGAIYEHDNDLVNENLAFYTQGDLQLTDAWSLTLGLRYSEDKRDALEQRGGYSELAWDSENDVWILDALAATAPPGFDTDQFFAPGVTPLAGFNVAMGAATFTGDPDNPIEPVCANEALTCDRPLRLGGLPFSFGSRVQGDYNDDKWTYRVNLNWEPNPDTLIYFGVTTGYRAGGFNLGGTDNRAGVDTDGDGFEDRGVLLRYEPEELTAYELGYKGALFDGRVQLNAALYYYDYENYQEDLIRWETSPPNLDLPPEVQGPPGRGPVRVTGNVPKSHNKGFEADGAWIATDRLTLGGNYSYTISEWDSDFTLFNEDDPRYPRAIMGGDLNQDPCTLPPDIALLYCANVEGEQRTGIPKHKGTVWGSYEWPMQPGRLIFNASVAITGKYYTSVFQRPWDEVPRRTRTDLRLTFLAADERWSASLFADNVFDEQYLRRADMESQDGLYGVNFPHRAVVLTPRYVGFEVTMNFGDWR